MPFKPITTLRNFLFPPRCIFCRENLPYDSNSHLCFKCGEKYSSYRPRGVNISAGVCIYALIYSGEVRRAILAFKFHNKPQYDRTLAAFLIPIVKSLETDCITWAPVSKLRLLKRGYDQSRLLADAVGRELNIPVVPLLRKHRHTRKQSTLSRDKRIKNIKDAYSVSNINSPYNLKIALIDDIVTTGSTISECAAVLKDAGARAVYCVALAHK